MNSIEIIKSMDFKAIELLFNSSRPVFEVEQTKAIAEYKVSSHDVFDENIRKKKKIIKSDIGLDGKETVTTDYIEPARIGMSFQQLIVDRRVGFMLTIPVKTDATYESESDKEKALVKLVDRLQNDNKMDYKNKEIARRWMSEMECAEIWYFVETGETKPKFTLKCNIWSPDLGDILYPLKDSKGDLIAFARKYKLKEEDKDIEHFDVYTNEFEYKYVNKDNVWKLDVLTETNEAGDTMQTNVNPIPNAVKKIMIDYISQPKPEYADQSSMISRLETITSNHSDINDYFGSPTYVSKGAVKGFAQKGEQGKIIELEDGGEITVLSWDSSPVSIKDEKEDLKSNIFMLSQTPDISFKAMSGMGTIAQFTMKAFFMDAHMAVARKEETFGIYLQRRLNIIKAAIGLVIDTSLAAEAKSLQLKPVITPYLPQNTTETIENLSVAKTGGIMSIETAVEQNPLVEDSETEMDRLRTDATNDLAGTENLPIKGKKTTTSKTGV